MMKILQEILDLLFTAGQFIVGTVIVKYIIGKWCAEQIMKWSKVWFAANERNWAIWSHYQNRALGDTHQHDSVLHCDEGKCTLFRARATI